jgi:putative NADH-flavin reductase
MNILLLGATGATGKEILRLALSAGHSMTVLVRNPDKIKINKSNLRIVVGDATNRDDVYSAIAENEILISALGAMNSSLMTDATKAILAASKGTNLKRVIMLSSFAVRRTRLTHVAQLLTGMVMKKIIDDKKSAENLLRNSHLEWTIVYAATLTNKSGGKQVRVLPNTEMIGLKNSIARRDVATWILDESQVGSNINTDVSISY